MAPGKIPHHDPGCFRNKLGAQPLEMGANAAGDVAIRLTSLAVSTVRSAATSTPRAISWVAAPCSVTAAAIALLIADFADRLFDSGDRCD